MVFDLITKGPNGSQHSMDQLVFFAKGVMIGLAIAAPVGPIGVLCIRRSLSAGMRAGLVTGLGAAAADAVYGAVAGFGLTSVSVFLLDHQVAIRTLGGAALLVIALRILFAPPAAARQGLNGEARLAGAFVSCFLLTLTNPTTILSFLAIFAGLGLAEWVRDYGAAAVLVLGVLLGSALWWLFLSGAVSLLRARLSAAALVWINRFSAAVILLFGLFALAPLLG
jgi:threonine/homoserine/homoserine lactone efflux protein